jgi:hypothetical protein
MQTIITRRLTLRPYHQTDAARVAYLAGDYDVAKMCGRVPHPYPIAAAYSFFDMLEHGQESGKEYAFAVTLPIDGVIGACGLCASANLAARRGNRLRYGALLGLRLCVGSSGRPDGLGPRPAGRESLRGRPLL